MRSPSHPASQPEPMPLLVEPLEPRIAPAAIDAGAATDPTKLVSITLGTPQFLHAGQILTTGQGGGAYLLYVEQGAIEVFTTDLNGNRNFDPDEITGIAAGPGLRLTLFSDVHGDIVTNLQVNAAGDNGDLTDSDNDATNGRDGRVLLPNSIDSITLRTITAGDLDSTIPGNTVANRIAVTSYSIFGSILTGGDFGSSGHGLLIDQSGKAAVATAFGTGVSNSIIGDIRTGTAAFGQYFHFGNTLNPNIFGPIDPTRINPDIGGDLVGFTPTPGAHGADIIGVKSVNNLPFSLGTLAAGNGGDGGAGTGGRGGSLSEVTLAGDHGGYSVIAGDGGNGINGGAGGAVTNLVDVGTSTGEVIVHSGNGGTGALGRGGDGGQITFGTISLSANVRVFLGNGGDGLTGGGNGASQPVGVFTTPAGPVPTGDKLIATTRDPYVFTDPSTGQQTFFPVPGSGAQLQFTTGPNGQRIPLHAFDNGTVRSVDFDGDGNFDAVYTSDAPDQIVILFGDGFGGFDQSKTLFLDAPILPQAVAIADFNADGRPDIIAASASATNLGGVSVFLNQINDSVRNPVQNQLSPITGAVNFTSAFTRNPLGDHPFSPPLQSAIPNLTGSATVISPPTVAIRALVPGDYNGDGVMDVALVGTFTNLFRTGPSDVALILFGDTNIRQPYGTGFFFANASQPTDVGPDPLNPGFFLPNPNIQFNDVGATSQQLPTLNAAVGSTAGPFSLAPRHDQFFAGQTDKKFITEYELRLSNDFRPLTPTAGLLANGPTPLLTVVAVSLGQVDTNRQLPGTSPNVTLVDAQLRDFTVGDVSARNIYDPVNLDHNYEPPTLSILTSTPTEFLVEFQGRGAAGDFANLTIGGAGGVAGSQRGAKINSPDSTPGFGASNARALRATDTDGDGVFNQIAIYDLPSEADDPTGDTARGGVRIFQGTVNLLPVDPPVISTFSGNDAVTNVGNFVRAATFTRGTDVTVTSFDPYRAFLGAAQNYGIVNPSRGQAGRDFVAFTGFGAFVHEPSLDYPAFNADVAAGSIDPNVPIFHLPRNGFATANGNDEAGFSATLADNGIRIFAGNGGSATFGPGGQGGVVGNGAFTPTPTGAAGGLAITITANPDYKGVITFNGGLGGSGFNVGNGVSTAGGNGGDLSGITTSGDSTQFNVGVRAGNGGLGINGPGGRGGDVTSVSIVAGNVFIAGNGGDGLQGGRGGNLLGNGRGVFDTTTGRGFSADAGLGGRGSLAGGNGGNITNLLPQFNTLFVSLSSGGIGIDDLIYNDSTPTSANGGASPGGAGGSGGIVLNSSPDSSLNLLGGDVRVRGGNGGDGLRGGSGGRVDTFINRATDPGAVLDSFFFLGGDGGAGINDLGGNGGVIQTISINGVGPLAPSSILTNRVIGGAGGASFGAIGGTGGFITGVNATSVSTPLAVASGTGGIGLTAGRDGGAVANNTLNAAGTGLRFGKLLVIAGAGGDAYARLPTDVIVPGDGQTADLVHQALGFGGTSGVGGNGASINNLTQPISIQTNVDLIAGNGGSTVTYGTSLDTTVNVGRGGSITNINILGEIGTSLRDAATNTSPPIKAYNDINNDGILDETIAQFVAANLRPGTFVLDSVSATGGNVGIVAGVAGSVAAINGVPQPASGASNGSVQNITARNIMSIVAGSVDAVAPVDNVTGLRLTSQDRVLGADKSPTFPAFGPGTPGFRADGAANSLVEFFAPNSPTVPTSILTGRIVTDLQPGYRLIDGAIFASANTTGDLGNQFGNPRVVIQP